MPATPRAGRPARALWGYGLLALGMIPLGTLYYAARGDLLRSNMSRISGTLGLWPGLACWGAATALYFFFFLAHLFSLTGYQRPWGRGLLFASSLCLMLGVAAPFSPERSLPLAQLHNVLAMSACLLSIAALYVFVFSLREKAPAVHRKALILLTAWVGTAAGIFLAGGITGLLEVFYTSAASVFLYVLYIWLYRAENTRTAS